MRNLRSTSHDVEVVDAQVLEVNPNQRDRIGNIISDYDVGSDLRGVC
jgi:hypothetical protein